MAERAYVARKCRLTNVWIRSCEAETDVQANLAASTHEPQSRTELLLILQGKVSVLVLSGSVVPQVSAWIRCSSESSHFGEAATVYIFYRARFSVLLHVSIFIKEKYLASA